MKLQKILIPPTYNISSSKYGLEALMQALSNLLLNSYLCIQIQAQTGVWDTHGVIFIFKTSTGQAYIQLQAQKGLTRVGPRRQMNDFFCLTCV